MAGSELGLPSSGPTAKHKTSGLRFNCEERLVCGAADGLDQGWGLAERDPGAISLEGTAGRVLRGSRRLQWFC
ncbi:hypothetical protein HN51_035260 [Arachis hypogaea]